MLVNSAELQFSKLKDVAAGQVVRIPSGAIDNLKPLIGVRFDNQLSDRRSKWLFCIDGQVGSSKSNWLAVKFDEDDLADNLPVTVLGRAALWLDLSSAIPKRIKDLGRIESSGGILFRADDALLIVHNARIAGPATMYVSAKTWTVGRGHIDETETLECIEAWRLDIVGEPGSQPNSFQRRTTPSPGIRSL